MASLVNRFASRLARLASFGTRADDPLTTIRATSSWIESLPAGDAFKSQEAILDALKRFNQTSANYTRDRLAIFMLLDEKSRDLQDTLVRQYLRNPRMSRPLESRLWHAVYGLYWEIARGYHAFALHLAGDGNKTDASLPPVTLRAIRAFGQLLKWRAVRYLPASEKLWLRLHHLYQIAERAGFHRQRQRAYADEAADCSCETAYLHVLMLALANAGTLYPRQLDLIDRWLRNWHGLLRLDSRIDLAAHHFVVDLAADRAPRRLRKPDGGDTLRFWTSDAVVQALRDLDAALRQGKSPAALGLTGAELAAESLELLEHLQYHWAPLAAREQRRAPREATKRLVDVTRGLGGLIRQIEASAAATGDSPYGEGFAYEEVDDRQVYGFVSERTRGPGSPVIPTVAGPSSAVERWVMQDESECGYGAIVESRDKDWLRVGALIGVKRADAREWKVGVVRRLSRLNDGTSSVGIETLAAAPVPATLRATAAPAYTVNGFDDSGASAPHPALWLHGDPDTLILDPIHFMAGTVFEIDGNGERKRIALGDPIERAEGWARVAAVPVNG
ncbi:MAG: hypothetical protein M0Z73_06595 [Betaproteobacteria bacterium]|nr:hypothetical protein [Betaproteobacteria bacterium]